MTVTDRIIDEIRREPGSASEIAHRVQHDSGSVAAIMTLLNKAGRIDRRGMPSQIYRGRTTFVYFVPGGARCEERRELTKEEATQEWHALRKPATTSTAIPLPRWTPPPHEANSVVRRCGARLINTRRLPQRAAGQG